MQRDTESPATSVALLLLGLLWIADLALIAVHVAKPYFAILRPQLFSLEADRGVAEYFQYAKEATIVYCLFVYWYRTNAHTFLVWSLFFAFTLVDDSFALHERFGEFAASAWLLPALLGLRPQDVGEGLFALFVGTLTLAAVATTARNESGRIAIVPSINIAALLGALAVCGVLADALHVIAYFRGSRWAWVLAIVEDGGELVVMSAIVAYCVSLAVCSRTREGVQRSSPFRFLDVGKALYAFAQRYQRTS